jgi:tRNA-splicing ligase RtcB
MSRTRAIERGRGRNIVRELAERGVLLRVHSRETAAEEMPEAYKDVSKVVEACVRAGIARPVARLQPLGCVKG